VDINFFYRRYSRVAVRRWHVARHSILLSLRNFRRSQSLPQSNLKFPFPRRDSLHFVLSPASQWILERLPSQFKMAAPSPTHPSLVVLSYNSFLTVENTRSSCSIHGNRRIPVPHKMQRLETQNHRRGSRK
jgi:hypothetical protein